MEELSAELTSKIPMNVLWSSCKLKPPLSKVNAKVTSLVGHATIMILPSHNVSMNMSLLQ